MKPLTSVKNIRLRSPYPSLYQLHLSRRNRIQNEKRTPLPGYSPPVVEFTDDDDVQVSLSVRDIDVLCLIQDTDHAIEHLNLIRAARSGSQEASDRLKNRLQTDFGICENYFENLKISETSLVIPSISKVAHPPELVSDKGAMLLELYREGYPVPEFTVLTSKCYSLSKLERQQETNLAVANLERLTGQRLGDNDNPLLLALRTAMPHYIPGLMPTYLNVGATEDILETLVNKYGKTVALKIYLNNVKNIYSLLNPTIRRDERSHVSSSDNIEQIEEAIESLSIDIRNKDPLVLVDARYQTNFFIEHCHRFFDDNEDMILTFTKGKLLRPSHILQQMVCTVRSNRSYPGVLYSRHPRTGRGHLIESMRSAFGEEIMTGTEESNLTAFSDREEIKNKFGAIYHFTPSLPRLEEHLESPVTVELGAESGPNFDFFALLQLNRSEMTGRATLVCAMDMFKKNIIGASAVTALVKPGHLRQINADSIHNNSFSKLQSFAQGISVLPRTAVSARIYFTASAALDAKIRGETVCFCKSSFVPSDNLVLSEMDAIISLTPAAIHVVTACLGCGMPAFLNLEKFGVVLDSQKGLVNDEGMTIKEGDWVTLSSKKHTLYKGLARFGRPRFEKYMNGEPLELDTTEIKTFPAMREAYLSYQELINDLQVGQIDNVGSLTKLVRTDLANAPEKAAKIVNNWYDSNTDDYVSAVLGSELGMHLERYMVYQHLTIERRIDFFKKAVKKCHDEGLAGLNAGSFMLGRFICIPHPIAFWEDFDEKTIAFLLNEWVLFEKYMEVLDDVGERRINRARQDILEKGLRFVRLRAEGAKNFMTLKLSNRKLNKIGDHLTPKSAEETYRLLSMLERPFSFFYDFSAKWSVAPLERLCQEENIKMPDSGDI